MKVYKIYDMLTGLYKNSGGYESWSKEGNHWKSEAAIKLHLRMFRHEEIKLTWEVHVFELVVESRHPITIFSKKKQKV